MKSFELSQRWLKVKTKLSGKMNISYHWILKSGLLKWLQLLYFFNLSSLLKESVAPVLTLPFPVAKGAWYQSSLNISFPAWKNFIFVFLMQHKTGVISVLRYDLQENKSSRSAPDLKPNVPLVATEAGNNWQVIFGHAVHLTHDCNPQLVHKIAKSNVLRHIKVPSLSVTTFKVSLLFLLCWWTTANVAERASAVMHESSFYKMTGIGGTWPRYLWSPTCANCPRLSSRLSALGLGTELS